MMSGIQFEQGEIWLVPFPFSDFSTNKKRPVLILSNEEYNKKNSDILVCQITSSLENKEFNISLNQEDLNEGVLPKSSEIRCDKINILEKSLFKKKFSKVTDSKFKECSVKIKKLIEKPKSIQDSIN